MEEGSGYCVVMVGKKIAGLTYQVRVVSPSGPFSLEATNSKSAFA